MLKKYVLKLFLLSTFTFILLQFYSNYSVFVPDQIKYDKIDTKKFINKKNSSNIILSVNNRKIDQNSKFIFEIDSKRLNKLFSLLAHKENENQIGFMLKKLGLTTFNDLKLESNQNFSDYFEYDGTQVRANEMFITLLNKISNYHSFLHQRNHIKKAKFKKTDKKPVIVTAANHMYYDALQATVYHIHIHFPNHKLIIYDLGLTEEMHSMTQLNCKCEVRKFDSDGYYSNIYPHVKELKLFSWKPIIIQESLRDFGSVLYVDTSIRFKSGEIKEFIENCKEIGLITQFIGLNFKCYTNPKMFEWFGEIAESYKNFNTIEANILYFTNNFVISLVMKAWVTCALDRNCISPIGSVLSPCCGCHRFDQSAITIIMSFFYGHPLDTNNYLPAYSLTKSESFFFDIKRYEGMTYFTKRI